MATRLSVLLATRESLRVAAWLARKRLLGAAALLVLRHQPRVGPLGGAAAHVGGAGQMGDHAEQQAQTRGRKR